jgi:hypothetical protein
MSGRDKEGLWALPSLVDSIEDCMRDLTVCASHDLIQHVARSPAPVELQMHKSAEVEISLLSVGGGGQSSPTRRHPSGTILIYRRLFGNLALRSVIVSQPHGQVRDVKRELLSEDDEGASRLCAGVGPLVLRRLGGLSRLVESTSKFPSGVLEVALFPPTREEEGLGGFSPWEDPDPLVLQMKVSGSTLEALLTSRSALETAEEGAGVNDRSEGTRQWAAGLNLNVGGLSSEIDDIVRRCLASRRVDPESLASLGLTHIRGLLLHGPPGTGKTLLARELAKQLGASSDTIKVVNGPEIFSKFVGEPERNVRELFAASLDEWEVMGDQSRLHVVILDELDAIAKARSGGDGDGSSTRDSVVNQLLAMMDGVQERSNFIVIGLTNRKDLIDPALLRPGRLEVHIQLSLPDAAARAEILNIAMRNMTASGLLDPDAHPRSVVPWLVGSSEGLGFSGADLVGLVRSAGSFAIARAFDQRMKIPFPALATHPNSDIREVADGAKKGKLNIVVRREDFEKALEETRRTKVGG